VDFNVNLQHQFQGSMWAFLDLRCPGPSTLPEIFAIGVDWNDLDVLENHLPEGQRLRAQCIREVRLFPKQMYREYLKMRMMALYPNLI
jgi:hypothetical protein